RPWPAAAVPQGDGREVAGTQITRARDDPLEDGVEIERPAQVVGQSRQDLGVTPAPLRILEERGIAQGECGEARKALECLRLLLPERRRRLPASIHHDDAQQ